MKNGTVMGAPAVLALSPMGNAREAVNGGMAVLGLWRSNGSRAAIDFTATTTSPMNSSLATAMRIILLLAALLYCSPACEATITQVSSAVCAGNSGANSVTTSAINTTGASLLVFTATDYSASAIAGTVNDSKGNSWHHLTSNYAGGIVDTSIWYAWDHGGTALSVGAGHTLTFGGSYLGYCLSAWTGTLITSDPLDQQAGNGTTGASITVASITPTLGNSLVIASLGAARAGVYTINGAYALAASFNYVSGGGMGNATGYWIQPASASTTGPVWTAPGSGDMAGAIASFKPGVAGPPPVTVRHRVVSQ